MQKIELATHFLMQNPNGSRAGSWQAGLGYFFFAALGLVSVVFWGRNAWIFLQTFQIRSAPLEWGQLRLFGSRA